MSDLLTDLHQIKSKPMIALSNNIYTTSLIYSVYVLEEDNHIFVCEWKSDHYTVTEYKNEEIFACCKLQKGGKSFFPDDISAISPESLVVACGWNMGLCYLKREKDVSMLKFTHIVYTEKQYCSLCCLNDNIYACDKYFGVDELTKDGIKLRSLRTQQLDWLNIVLGIFRFPLLPSQFSYYHRIRANPSTENIWVLNKNKRQIFCFNNKGNLLKLFEGINQEEIEDICLDANEFLYYCTRTGIFLLNYKIRKQLHQFKKKSECSPRIYFLKNTIFVSIKIDGKLFIDKIVFC